ncbi:MFS transporter [Pseudarthrobacter sp. B4EP4b]|uniref:MFS transporter n=1 Tax=Pseudarthrobacter sp. B4EP4b TaxID=2590664 RepID=UPI00114EEDE4|nr:MFS transporter [Pseudarthrobacter sp. B4EP4b]
MTQIPKAVTSAADSSGLQQTPDQRRQMRRVLWSSYIGSTVEFYDFLVYGTAASLVFGQIFFADLDPLVGTIASFGTLAAGYAARPLGGVIFGHFGDRLGRKQMLILTMMLMGVSSTLIGLLPSQQQIGAAPVILILLRIIQGIALGGEWGGATLMALEHSTSRRRGLSVAIVNAGAPTGAVLAAGIMGVFSLLPQDQFLSWGWRIPFLISAVLVAVALWVRLGVHESPIFQQAQEAAKLEAPTKKPVPLIEVLRHPKGVLLSGLAGIAPLAIQSLMATFALTFAILGGTDRSVALFAAAIASVVNMVTLPLFGALSDRLGRRPVLAGGLITAAVLAYPIFSMIGSGNTAMVFTGYFLGYGLVVAALMGTLSSFISEQFSTTSRYTGASLGYQLGATLGAGFAPLIAANLLTVGGPNATLVAIFVGALAVVSGLAVLATRESFRKDLL